MIRPVEPDDAAAVAALVGAGFETYRTFAPDGWEPPPQRAAAYRQRIEAEGNWGLVAHERGELVGHIAFDPAPIPGLAHLWNLYVAEAHWGSGLGTTLHRRAVAAAAEQGYDGMRLYVPAGQARARRFYEREGWRFERDAVTELDIGLDLIELRRRLKD